MLEEVKILFFPLHIFFLVSTFMTFTVCLDNSMVMLIFCKQQACHLTVMSDVYCPPPCIVSVTDAIASVC